MKTQPSNQPDKHPAPPPAFHIMTKPRGAICNLACKYCYFLSKEELYPGSDFRMSDELLEEYTRQYIQSQRTPEVTFAWQGGEPTLMGLDFFRKAVELQRKYRKPGMQIRNSIQTNGLQIDDEWAQFFRRHDFLVGVSLDGPAELHDVYRLDKGGQPTHRRVMQGIEILRDQRVDFNILCCVHSANAAHPLEVYRYLRDQAGAAFVQFIPIVERETNGGDAQNARVTQRSVEARAYGQFLAAVFDEWVRRDVGQVFVQIFDVALGAWLGQRPGLCIFEETCGLALAMEHNGDLYSCDHFVEPDYRLGNIHEGNLIELVTSQQQRDFGLAKRDALPSQCLACEVRFVCNGGCPKNRIRTTADGEQGLNYLCEGYKTFFTHIDQPMKMMAALLRMGRAPAKVMPLLADVPSSKKKRRKRRR